MTEWKPFYEVGQHLPITRAYEDALRDHYRLRQTWSKDPRTHEIPIEPHHHRNT